MQERWLNWCSKLLLRFRKVIISQLISDALLNQFSVLAFNYRKKT